MRTAAPAAEPSSSSSSCRHPHVRLATLASSNPPKFPPSPPSAPQIPTLDRRQTSSEVLTDSTKGQPRNQANPNTYVNPLGGIQQSKCTASRPQSIKDSHSAFRGQKNPQTPERTQNTTIEVPKKTGGRPQPTNHLEAYQPNLMFVLVQKLPQRFGTTQKSTVKQPPTPFPFQIR